MSPYYYHLKFELYATPDPTETGDRSGHTGRDHDNIWVPSAGASIFDDLPSHPPARGPTHNSKSENLLQRGYDSSDTYATAAAAANSRVIDCGRQRGRAHDTTATSTVGYDAEDVDNNDDERSNLRLNKRQHRALVIPRASRAQASSSSSPPPRVADGIGPQTAVRDWRFGRINIESFDAPSSQRSGSEEMNNNNQKNTTARGAAGPSSSASQHPQDMAAAAAATPAASLGPNLGGMGLATKARYVPLETKNTEAGWGIVHLYREGDESSDLRELPEASAGGPAEGGSRGRDGATAGDEEGAILCIPAVPSYMSPSDFLGFVGEKWRRDVSHYRMVMTSIMSRYMVLMKFRDLRRAREWRKEFDGKPFDSVETEICHVTFIKSITVETPDQTGNRRKASEGNNDRFSPASPVNSMKPFPPPTPNLIELPTCAVCLERMDDTTGLMTILCQHVFHCTCLQTWKGSGCPVCRATNPKPNADGYDPDNPYSRPFGSGVSNICANCNCTDDLWICLICGNVGCGRYNGGHAKEHWKLTAHSFSLELETQHVWDYAGDMWVHRLIRDKGDGKVVELPRNNNANNPNTQPPQAPGTAAAQREDEDVVPRAKLDGIGMEYTHLLTSQLESQRVYFEEMVSKAADKAAQASAAAEAATSQAGEALRQLAALREEHATLRDETVPALERDLAREKSRAAKSAELARGLGRALQEEKEVSAGLMKRIEHLQAEVEGAGKAAELARMENEELKEMNRDLSMFISGQEKLREMEKEGMVEQGELEEGKVGVAEGSGGGRRKGKGRGKK